MGFCLRASAPSYSFSQKELWKEVADWEGAGRGNICLKEKVGPGHVT